MALEHEECAISIQRKLQRIERLLARLTAEVAALHEEASVAAQLAGAAGLIDAAPFVPMSGGGDKPDDD
jgi:hypothetical protein